MTRLQSQIIAQLRRGPYTTLDLALALDETTAHIRKAVEALDVLGLVDKTPDGWKLTEQVAA